MYGDTELGIQGTELELGRGTEANSKSWGSGAAERGRHQDMRENGKSLIYRRRGGHGECGGGRFTCAHAIGTLERFDAYNTRRIENKFKRETEL